MIAEVHAKDLDATRQVIQTDSMWFSSIPTPIWIAGAALLAAVLGLVLWLWRTRPWRGAKTRWPVVLVHGIMGFDEIGIGPYRKNYFKGVADHLRSLGLRVYQPRLPALASVSERAEALARALEHIPERRVNLVAHSMGGLDARYAISRLGCRRRVASLTTLGTPHRGTPIADLGSVLLGDRFGLGKFLAKAGLGIEAVHDMTTARMDVFNQQVPNVRGVRYISVVAELDDGTPEIHPLLKPSRAYLNLQGLSGDGLVPADSQAWGTVIERIRVDHWAEIGWSTGLDTPAFYERLARRVRRMGG